MRRQQGRSSRGQALTELAIIAPIMLLLILGTYDTSIMATDKALAVSAVRHAARSGAELGGTNNKPATCTGTLPSSTALKDVDASIVQTVLATTANMIDLGGVPGFAPKGSPEEIDIYHPAPFLADGFTPNTSGVIDTSNNHYEKFTYPNFATAQAGPPAPYILDERCQGPLSKDSDIGVRLIWSYVPANGIPGPSFKNIVEYAVERMSLCSDNCNPPP